MLGSSPLAELCGCDVALVTSSTVVGGGVKLVVRMKSDIDAEEADVEGARLAASATAVELELELELNVLVTTVESSFVVDIAVAVAVVASPPPPINACENGLSVAIYFHRSSFDDAIHSDDNVCTLSTNVVCSDFSQRAMHGTGKLRNMDAWM